MRLLLPILSIAVLLSACGSDSKNNVTLPETSSDATPPHGPIFDPASAKIPTTNDVLFKGSVDGTLNIPNTDNNSIIAAINELDGFSTSIPITADFDMSLDPATLVVGDTLHIYEVTKNQQGAVTSIVRELTKTDIIATPTGDKATTLALVPLMPLKESSSYLVILTNGIKDPAGKVAQASSAYSLARSSTVLTDSDFAILEPLRQLINNMEDMAASTGIDKSKIVLSWSFTTQSTTAVLQQVADTASASNIVIAPTGKTSNDFVSLLAGMADISIGTLDLPYYLEAPSTDKPTAPLSAHWQGINGSILTRFNTTPIATSTLNVPVIMTTPNATSGQTKPAEGWPVIMYLHGITRNRLDILGYADTMARAGFAMIAIDLPLHGIDETSNPLHASNTPFPNDIEPTFDVDFVNNETEVSEADGMIDESGSHFINLNSLLTARDNLRQGVANQLVLRRSLKNIAEINSERVGVIAHSLGGIVAASYLGVENKSMPSSLITTGAGIATLLRDSIEFGPVIKASLAAEGVTGADYEAVILGSQWILDSADPINFAKNAAQKHPIHLMEIVGDGGKTHLADQVIPNTSTKLLVTALSATVASDAINPVSIANPRIVRFTQGSHGTIISPSSGAPEGTSYLNVYLEMHSQLGQFHTSGGETVVINNFAIVEKEETK